MQAPLTSQFPSQFDEEVLLHDLHRSQPSHSLSSGSADFSDFSQNSFSYGAGPKGRVRSATYHPSSRGGSESSISSSPGSADCIQPQQVFAGLPARTQRSRAASINVPYPYLRQASSFDGIPLNYSSFSPTDFWQTTSPVSAPTSAVLQYRPDLPRQASEGGLVNSFDGMRLQHSSELAEVARKIDGARNMSAAEKARGAFVQTWLTNNYVYAAEGNCSRQGLYASYKRSCVKYKVREMNCASFGKAVRAAFPAIKTRRLGNRGNSKYHYCGMAPSNASEASILTFLSANPDANDASQPSSSAEDDSLFSPAEDTFAEPSFSAQIRSPSNLSPGGPLADPILPFNFPADRDLLCCVLTSQASPAQAMWLQYSRMCAEILYMIQSGEYEKFEAILQSFYQANASNSEARLVMEQPGVRDVLLRADSATYAEAMNILKTNLDAPINSQLLTSLRKFAQKIEEKIIIATNGLSPFCINPKIELAARFSHLMIRYVGLCQLVQALQGMFSNSNTLEQLRASWGQVDVEHIRNHCALAANLEHNSVFVFLESFRTLLSSEHLNAASYISWIENTRAMFAPSQRSDAAGNARSMLMRISFIFSQITRDMTLRSDSAFGTFQILGSFAQDWLGFLLLLDYSLETDAVSESMASTNAVNFTANIAGPSSLANEYPRMAPLHLGGSSPDQFGSSMSSGMLSVDAPQYIQYSGETSYAMATPLANAQWNQGQPDCNDTSGWVHSLQRSDFPSSATRSGFDLGENFPPQQ